MAPDPGIPDGASDARIFERCLRGDKRAWDAFVERYAKLVYWSIWKALENGPVGRREEDCQEAFQDFFKRILEPSRMEKLAGAASPRKYLQVMAGRLVFERYRRSDVSARFEVPHETVDESELSADSQEETVRAERAAILEGVLGLLKSDERACLEHFYLDGQTHAQIAQILGLSEEAVSSTLRRTREKVKERLRKRGLGEER